MGYSQEYKDWTGENVEADFTIEEISKQVMPEEEKEVICDGIGFVALSKDENGVLSVKMNEENGGEVVLFYNIIENYKPTPQQD
jgi:hypothetical protein